MSDLIKADLIIKNAKIIDVFNREIFEDNLAIKDGEILGFGSYYENAKEYFDAQGAYLCPSLIDGHVHIESSMLSAAELSKYLTSRGILTIIADPHEIANVCGLDGMTYILDEAKDLPFNIYMMLASCVPSTSFETSGAKLLAKDLAKLIDHENVLGLGEMMNYPGLVNQDKDILDKIALAKERNLIADGHCPGLSGRDLDIYIKSGIATDHECRSQEEMKEKLRKGMFIQIREGSAAKDFDNLIGAVNKNNLNRCFFCTDDRHPEDLINEGSVDNNVRKAIAYGLDPIDAIKMATINTASAYKLDKLGAIAPSYEASFFLFDDFKDLKCKSVFYRGELVYDEGKYFKKYEQKFTDKVKSPMRARKIEEKDLDIYLENNQVFVIGMNKNSLVTDKLIRKVKVVDGKFSYADDGIKKIVVCDRYSQKTNIGLGLITGYPITNGAVASTIAHDSHNIVAIGDNDRDLILAINRLIDLEGGLVVSSKGEILGDLKLEIAGLMSRKSINELNKSYKVLYKQLKNLGLDDGIDPFMSLGFMALPVIPHLKMTDLGLFDNDIFALINISCENLTEK